MLLVIIATSSTHSRHVDLSSILIWFVVFARLMSLLISSTSVAYCVTPKSLSYAVLYASGPCQAMFSPDGGC